MILSLSRVTWTRHLGKPPSSSTKIRGARLVDPMTVFEKTVQNTLLDRVRNRAFVVFRLFWGLKGFVNLKLLGSRIR